MGLLLVVTPEERAGSQAPLCCASMDRYAPLTRGGLIGVWWLGAYSPNRYALRDHIVEKAIVGDSFGISRHAVLGVEFSVIPWAKVPTDAPRRDR